MVRGRNAVSLSGGRTRRNLPDGLSNAAPQTVESPSVGSRPYRERTGIQFFKITKGVCQAGDEPCRLTLRKIPSVQEMAAQTGGL